METSGDASNRNEKDNYDAKNLWSAMVVFESSFEQRIDEVSRDLRCSFQQTTQFTSQLNEIQLSLSMKGKEVQHEVLPMFSNHRTKFTKTHSSQRVTHG